ncbi:hypothetical protein PGB90_009196 [Kerria lacca]
MNPCSRKVLMLYRDLLRYSKNLQLSDKEYFMNRIKDEFKRNKPLENPDEIEFQYKKGITLLKNKRILILLKKYTLDLSKVPTLNENDLKEQFVHGSGPGGQSVNRTLNCVVLTHKLSGIVVKCHESRSLEKNRKKAREILVRKLDNAMNGEDSIENQKKIIDRNRRNTYELKRKKLNELKEKWKKREFSDNDKE